MGTAHGIETTNQNVIACIEKQYRWLHAEFGNFIDGLQQRTWKHAGTHVSYRCDLLNLGLLHRAQLEKINDGLRRDVVGNVVAFVLQDFGCGGQATTRHTGDEDGRGF